MPAQRIAVVGAGAWGTALANVIARVGRRVTLWARNPAIAATIVATRESPRLPGVRIDDRVTLAALSDGAPAGDAILVVVPAQALRAAVSALAGGVAPGTPVVACAKGIERGTGRFMTEIIAECLPAAIPAILSGPSFAGDVARGLPTAVTLAAPDEATARMLAQSIGSATFRPYHSTDMRGVEIGGAAKNVLAIAAGIVVGRRLGASAAAALTTRGFAELVRFGRTYGARAETLTGLSGLRRPDPDLLERAVAKFPAWPYAGGRQHPRRGAARRPARRGRLHRIGAGRHGAGAAGRDPGRRGRRRRSRRDARRRRGDRGAADAAVPRGGMNMNYWLIKSEPDAWSWDDQVAKGAKGEAWTGVRNHTAKQNLMKMKKGDRAFFYHSGEGKEIVGIAEVIRESFPDPTASPGDPWVAVDVKAMMPLEKPVSLAAIKAEPKLEEMALVKQSRLSVQPVTAQEWKLVCAMGGVKP